MPGMRSECFNIQAFDLSATEALFFPSLRPPLFHPCPATAFLSTPTLCSIASFYVYISYFSSIRSLSRVFTRPNNFSLDEFLYTNA